MSHKGFGARRQKATQPSSKATERTVPRVFLTDEDLEDDCEFKGMLYVFINSPRSRHAVQQTLKVAQARNLDIILVELSKAPTKEDPDRQQAQWLLTTRENFKVGLKDDNETAHFRDEVLKLLDTLPHKEGHRWVIAYTEPFSSKRLQPMTFPVGDQSSNAESAV